MNELLVRVQVEISELKSGLKEVVESKEGVDSKLKVVDELKKDMEEVKELRNDAKEVGAIKEQIEELRGLAAGKSDNSKEMEEFVEVKLKRIVKDMKAEVEESLDIEQRKCNVLLLGVEEGSDDISLDCIDINNQVDSSRVLDILKRGLRLSAENHIENVTRIGKVQTGKPRLLKVQLKSLEGRNEILKRAKDLRNNEDFKKIFIVPDLTRKQQLLDKELRDKVKELRASGQQNIMIRAGKVIKNLGEKKVEILYCPSS
jgi:hypothetical protein